MQFHFFLHSNQSNPTENLSKLRRPGKRSNINNSKSLQCCMSVSSGKADNVHLLFILEHILKYYQCQNQSVILLYLMRFLDFNSSMNMCSKYSMCTKTNYYTNECKCFLQNSIINMKYVAMATFAPLHYQLP